MAKFKAGVAGQLDKLRGEAAELEGQLTNWQGVMAARCVSYSRAI